MLMMKKTVPFFFLAAGIAGFFLRRTEMNTVFDPNTGFAETGATISALLTAITVVVLIGAAVFAFAMKAKDKEPDKIFALGRAEFIAYTVCGVAQIAAGIMWLLERESVVGFVAGILAAISGGAVVLGTVAGAVVSVGWVVGGTTVQPAISVRINTADRKSKCFFMVVTRSFVGVMINGGGHCWTQFQRWYLARSRRCKAHSHQPCEPDYKYLSLLKTDHH